MGKKLSLVLMGLAVIFTAGLGVIYLRILERPHVPMVQIGGPFTLASTKGGEVNSESLKGHPYAVFFGFTHCPEVCPTTMNDMTGALQKLGDAAKDFRVFFISVDPERDSVAYLTDYLQSFDPRIEGLVPTLAQLPQLAQDFRVVYEKVPTSGGDYTMNHTASVFLYDSQGQFAGTLAYGEAEETRLKKLGRLLGN